MDKKYEILITWQHLKKVQTRYEDVIFCEARSKAENSNYCYAIFKVRIGSEGAFLSMLQHIILSQYAQIDNQIVLMGAMKEIIKAYNENNV